MLKDEIRGALAHDAAMKWGGPVHTGRETRVGSTATPALGEKGSASTTCRSTRSTRSCRRRETSRHRWEFAATCPSLWAFVHHRLSLDSTRDSTDFGELSLAELVEVRSPRKDFRVPFAASRLCVRCSKIGSSRDCEKNAPPTPRRRLSSARGKNGESHVKPGSRKRIDRSNCRRRTHNWTGRKKI
jgi:hypothetical protein